MEFIIDKEYLYSTLRLQFIVSYVGEAYINKSWIATDGKSVTTIKSDVLVYKFKLRKVLYDSEDTGGSRVYNINIELAKNNLNRISPLSNILTSWTQIN